MTSVRASATLSDDAVSRPRTWSLSSVLLPVATAIVISALALLVLMTPSWMHFAMDLSGGSRALATPELSHQLSDQTVAELFLGPGGFTSFAADEAGHMRDVRVVLWGFLGVAATSLVFVAWTLWRNRSSATWRAMARGGLLLAAAVVIAGVFAALAFGVAFELFHRIFFPGGNWAFSADSMLIRLYPYEFWQLTSAALGLLAVLGGVGVWFAARRRARA